MHLEPSTPQDIRRGLALHQWVRRHWPVLDRLLVLLPLPHLPPNHQAQPHLTPDEQVELEHLTGLDRIDQQPP